MDGKVKRLRTRLALKHAHWALDERTIGVTFGSREAYLRLAILGRAFPDSADAWDRDALLASVSIDIGEFQGGFELTTFGHELEGLRQLLQELDRRRGERAEGRFRFLDSARLYLVFRLLRDGHGYVAIDVDVRDQDGSVPLFRFSVGGNDEDLRAWIEALDVALEVFPPVIQTQPAADPLRYNY